MKIKNFKNKIVRKAQLIYITIILSILRALPVHAQTSTPDMSSMTNMINSFLPLLVTIIVILIPLIFLKKILELFENLFKGFS